MKLKQLIDWLQVIANVGIVVGLILVLFQMRQNEELLRAEIINQYTDSYTDYETAFAGENLPVVWAKSIEDPENLTLPEMRALEAVTFVPVLRWINLYRQSEAGILKEFDWKAEVENDVNYYLNTPWARAWWQHYGYSMHEAGFLPLAIFEIIERDLNDPDEMDPAAHYMEMQKILRENRKAK